MLRMNCLYWPKSPPHMTPILPTYSLCGCTVESLPQQMLSSPSPSSCSSHSSHSSSCSSCSSCSPHSSSCSSRSMSATLVLSAVVRLNCSAATLPHAPHVPPHTQPCYMVKSATACSTSPPKHCTLESPSVSSHYLLFTTLAITTPLSSCTAESGSPDATATHHSRCHHPSQQLYCRELLP